MRPVTPTVDLPDNVKAVKFSPPPDMEGIGEVVGLVHLDDAGEGVALEFMFELTKDEIKVLRHEPYLTLTVMSDHLHPFAMQTTYPPGKKYDDLMEHSHVCTENLAHEKQLWWRCDNPSHNDKTNQIRMCDKCFAKSTSDKAVEEESSAPLQAVPDELE